MNKFSLTLFYYLVSALAFISRYGLSQVLITPVCCEAFVELAADSLGERESRQKPINTSLEIFHSLSVAQSQWAPSRAQDKDFNEENVPGLHTVLISCAVSSAN